MPWIKVFSLFMIAVMAASSLRVGHEGFSGMGVPYGSITNRTIHFGKLIIGNGVQGATSNDTVERQGEQSDGQTPVHLAEAKLKRLGPSVHCGDDAMTLRVPGLRTPRLLVNGGEGSPVPVSQIPASCGLSVKRVRRDTALVAPYHGCHVRQQGGSYVLPLLLMGLPVQMACPVTSLPTVSCLPSGMVFSLGAKGSTVQIKVAGSWQPLLLSYSTCEFTLEIVDGALVVTAPFKGSCWEIKDGERRLPLMYGERELTLSCPDTPPTTVPTTIPASDPTAQVVTTQVPQMYYPFPYGAPWWYFPHSYPKGPEPEPTTQAPPTTTTTAAAPQDPIPQLPMFPQMFNPYFLPQQQPNWYEPFSPHHHYPYGGHNFPHPYPGYPVPTLPPTTAPTTTTTTTAQPVNYPQDMQYPMYPMFPPHLHYLYGLQGQAATTPATTTTPAPTTTAAQPAQYPGYPQMYPFLYGPQPIKSQVPSVKYPFMPQYPGFAPRSPKSVPSPTWSPVVYRSRRYHSKVR